MQFEYTALGLLALIAVETSVLTWKTPKRLRSKKYDRPIFVDTSVLMDGRIVSVAQTGFITSELIIPRSVLLELQLLADKSDHDKRERARYGLDVVAELQALDMVQVRIMDEGKALSGVDEQLLELAKEHHGMVMTIDFNLNKVATVEHVPILNLNELAQNLRMMHLPGEKFAIELVDKGSENHQGVGYLSDGTMVVVENGSSRLGQTHTVECIRSLQTVAGKMMFARLVEDKRSAKVDTKLDTKPKNTQPSTRSYQNKSSRQNKPAYDHPKQTPSTTRHDGPRPNNRPPRPATSKQNEASLIRIIDQQ